MKRAEGRIVFTQMHERGKLNWNSDMHGCTTQMNRKQRLRNLSISAAAVLCLSVFAGTMLRDENTVQAMMGNVTAEFDYDETLGRLQFVSNILPESAMVFLESTDEIAVCAPTLAEVTHVWSEDEPWFEFACMGGIKACSDGEVMTIVRNRENEYTVRLSHENGYESVYSGLRDVQLKEHDRVLCGERIGGADGFTAFELRKDGLSVLPVFSEQ